MFQYAPKYPENGYAVTLFQGVTYNSAKISCMATEMVGGELELIATVSIEIVHTSRLPLEKTRITAYFSHFAIQCALKSV